MVRTTSITLLFALILGVIAVSNARVMHEKHENPCPRRFGGGSGRCGLYEDCPAFKSQVDSMRPTMSQAEINDYTRPFYCGVDIWLKGDQHLYCCLPEAGR